MSSFDTHPLRYIRFVHRPYKRPDKYSIATPRQKFDHTRVYRVLTEGADGSMVDVVSPVSRIIDDMVVKQSIMALFYVGAEADLDRYLRWLHNVGLLDETRRPKPIHVVEQMVSDFMEEREHLTQRDAKVSIMFPGQMDDELFLVDISPGKSKKVSIY